MSTMNEARFHDLVDALQQQVEDAFDDSDLDLDLENAGGVLTVRFENGSQLILSRQAPLRQLWVAAKVGRLPLRLRRGQRPLAPRWQPGTAGRAAQPGDPGAGGRGC